ncbi:MAG: tetratricopeptide repeat protein [Bacteroidales bacterium]|nr:tetratricopeptide repeat protein [Bacteroidales bacterium]
MFKYQMLYIFIIVFLNFLPFSAFSSNLSEIDSLKTVLKVTDGPEKATIFNALSKKILSDSAEYSYEFADSALRISKKFKLKTEEILALTNLGDASYFSNKINRAKDFYQQAMVLSIELKDSSFLAINYRNLGYVYLKLSDYKNALDNFSKSLECEKIGGSEKKIAEALNNVGLANDYLGRYKNALDYYLQAVKINETIYNKEGISTSSNNIGNIYITWGNNEKALLYYLKSLKIEEELNSKSGIAIALNNIGIVYHNWKNYDKALEYYQQGLNIEKELQNKPGIAKSMNNIAIIFDETGKFDEAIDYYNKSLELEKEIGDQIGVSISLSNIGEFYEERNDYDKAFDYYMRSIKIDEKIGNKPGIGQTYNQLGNLFARKKQYKKAINYYIKSNEVVEPLNIIETIAENYKGLGNIYANINDFNKAYYYSNKYHALNDSIFSIEMLERQNNLQADFEIEKREKEIELLNAEKQVKALEISKKELKINRQDFLVYVLYFGIVAFLFFFYLLIRQNANKNKANKLLHLQNEEIKKNRIEIIAAKESAEESDRLKSAFLASVSHEIRTPLNGILGFSELIRDMELSLSERNEYIDLISLNGQQLVAILNDIIDISQIETGQLKMNPIDCNIDSLLFDLLTYYEGYKKIIGKPGIKIRLKKNQIKSDLILKVDTYRLKQILSNLIGNATKFTDKGYIEFGYIFKNEVIEFFVKDTGIGIPKENLEMIFDRFRQVDETLSREYGGTGLGLAISKQLVNLMDGDIWVKSEVGKGSTFYFALPLALESDKNLQNINDDSQTNKFNWLGKNILVAEDVKSNFDLINIELKKSNATVIHARNGKEALEIIKTQDSIDLILMDLEMPVMNGMDATIEINKINNKVPIVALTAYAMQHQRKEILKLPFKEYITKPVNLNMLLETIGKIFSNK